MGFVPGGSRVAGTVSKSTPEGFDSPCLHQSRYAGQIGGATGTNCKTTPEGYEPLRLHRSRYAKGTRRATHLRGLEAGG